MTCDPHPTGFVAADLRIDHDAVVQAEEEGVRIVAVVRSIFLGNAPAGVFDDASAFRDEADGVNAALMHAGWSGFEERRSFVASGNQNVQRSTLNV